MNHRASADIWWIIIGAVMALVVLIIITVIFTGRTGTLTQELGEHLRDMYRAGEKKRKEGDLYRM